MKALEQAIYSALTGRAQLTALLASSTSVFPDVVPANEDLPAVVYALQPPSRDEYVYGGGGFEELRYVVQGIVESFDPEAAADIAEQINTALVGSKIAISGRTTLLGLRVGRISYPERDPSGTMYQHRGGIYRWLVQ